MSIEHFIEHYGYLAILLGTFFEGETVLVLGGFVAHRGYLDLPWVILAAFVGSLSGDQLYFFLGRKHGPFILRKRPSWKGSVEKINSKLHRHHTLLILWFRFFYGFRTVTPFVLGMSPVSKSKFIVLNAAGAALWAVSVGTGGYLFGHALEVVLGDLRHYELEVIATILAIGVVLWAAHFIRKTRRKEANN